MSNVLIAEATSVFAHEGARLVVRMLRLIREWLQRRRDEQRDVELDAQALLKALGPAAYYEARARARDEREGKVVDVGKPAGHWANVRRRLAVPTGKDRQADSATRRLTRLAR